MTRLVIVAVFLSAVSCGGDTAERDSRTLGELQLVERSVALSISAMAYESGGWPNLSEPIEHASEVLLAAAQTSPEYDEEHAQGLITIGMAAYLANENRGTGGVKTAADVLADAEWLASLASDYESDGLGAVSVVLMRTAGVMRAAVNRAAADPGRAPRVR